MLWLSYSHVSTVPFSIRTVPLGTYIRSVIREALFSQTLTCQNLHVSKAWMLIWLVAADGMVKAPGSRTNCFHKGKQHRPMANFWISAHHVCFLLPHCCLAWHGPSLFINNSRQLRLYLVWLVTAYRQWIICIHQQCKSTETLHLVWLVTAGRFSYLVCIPHKTILDLLPTHLSLSLVNY